MSWSHYCELLSISDPDKRSFYEKEAIKEQLIAQVEAVLDQWHNNQT